MPIPPDGPFSLGWPRARRPSISWPSPFDLKLPTVSKHLKVLQRAGLISQARKAQWRPCRLETARLKEVADWVDHYVVFGTTASANSTTTSSNFSKRRRTVATSDSAHQTTRRVGKLTLTVKSELEVEITRVFDAPRRLVFEAHSKPEHMRRWWGPRGTTMVGCEMDFRPGGRYRFVLRKEKGQAYAFRGEYREIVPPERLVQTFEFEGLPGSVSLETQLSLSATARRRCTTTSQNGFHRGAGRHAQVRHGGWRGRDVRPPRGASGTFSTNKLERSAARAGNLQFPQGTMSIFGDSDRLLARGGRVWR